MLIRNILSTESSIVNLIWVCWSRDIHISLDDKPLPCIQAFKRAVAMASANEETGLPHRWCCRRSSHSSFLTACCATGFSFLFLTKPTSTEMWCWFNSLSFINEEKPAAASTLMIAGGPPRGKKFNTKSKESGLQCVLLFIIYYAGGCEWGDMKEELVTALDHICCEGNV